MGKDFLLEGWARFLVSAQFTPSKKITGLRVAVAPSSGQSKIVKTRDLQQGLLWFLATFSGSVAR